MWCSNGSRTFYIALRLAPLPIGWQRKRDVESQANNDAGRGSLSSLPVHSVKLIQQDTDAACIEVYDCEIGEQITIKVPTSQIDRS